ncbi:hypothetical protein J2788_004121 [Variovorax paradoxus]|nr:hypothetical protein [Variovorax paradoxus]
MDESTALTPAWREAHRFAVRAAIPVEVRVLDGSGALLTA